MDRNKHTRAPHATEPGMDMSEYLRTLRSIPNKGSRSDSNITPTPTSKHNTADSPQFTGYPQESTRSIGSRSIFRLPQVDGNSGAHTPSRSLSSGVKLPQVDGNSRSHTPSRSLSSGISLHQVDAHPFQSGIRLPQIDARSRPHASEVRSSRGGNPPSSKQLQQGPSIIIPLAETTRGSPMPRVDGTYVRSAHDIEMASKQTRIEAMSPPEREEQEKWALDQLFLLRLCPMGFGWRRIKDGYLCNGGIHYTTDALLAQGKLGTLPYSRIMGPGPGWQGLHGPGPSYASYREIEEELYSSRRRSYFQQLSGKWPDGKRQR